MSTSGSPAAIASSAAIDSPSPTAGSAKSSDARSAARRSSPSSIPAKITLAATPCDAPAPRPVTHTRVRTGDEQARRRVVGVDRRKGGDQVLKALALVQAAQEQHHRTVAQADAVKALLVWLWQKIRP